jgi:arginine/ornithine N-succinyltransferase beta subunit
MRLDLINSSKNYKYREGDLFDFYYNVFDLGPSIQIRSGTPMDSIRYHRFVYVTRDRQMEQSCMIMILPYLHERRIYLNRQLDNM